MILERGTSDAVTILGAHGVFLMPDIGVRAGVVKVRREWDGLEFCQWSWRLRGEPGEVYKTMLNAPSLGRDKMLDAFLEQQGATPV